MNLNTSYLYFILLQNRIELTGDGFDLYAFNHGSFTSLEKPIEPAAFPSAKSKQNITKILRHYAYTIRRNAVCSPWVHNAWCRA